MIEGDQLIKSGESLAVIIGDRGEAILWYHPWSDSWDGSQWDDLISRLDALGFTRVPGQADAVIDEYVVWFLRRDSNDSVPGQRDATGASQLLGTLDTR